MQHIYKRFFATDVLMNVYGGNGLEQTYGRSNDSFMLAKGNMFFHSFETFTAMRITKNITMPNFFINE